MKKPEAVVFDVDDTCLDFCRGFRDHANAFYGWELVGLPDKHSMEGWIPVEPEEKDEVMVRFNLTWEFGCLKPLPWAVHYLKHFCVYNELRKEKIKIILLSKCGSDDVTQALRRANLALVFGIKFDDIIMINYDESKKVVLRRLQSDLDIRLHVDDFVQNCRESIELGIPSVVMRHSTNVNVTPRYDLPVVDNWHELYDHFLMPLLCAREDHG